MLYHPKLPIENNTKKSLKYLQYMKKVGICEEVCYNTGDFSELLKLKSINSIINYHKIYNVNLDHVILFIQKKYVKHSNIIPFINDYLQSRIYLYSNAKIETNLIRLVFKFQNMFVDYTV